MTHHMIFKYSDNDSVKVTIRSGDEREDVFLDVRKEVQHVHIDLDSAIAKIPLSSFRRELVYFAAAVYSADKRILRAKGYDKWTRDIHIHFPVIDTEKWNQVKGRLKSVLSFLTGDRWGFTFYPSAFYQEFQQHFTYKDIVIDSVALLSGGLDSFIGAVDLLETHNNAIMFVSHRPRGNSESVFQTDVVRFLDEKYPNKVHHIDVLVQPHRGQYPKQYKNSSRSRSFFYTVLGIAVADSLECSSFVIPENGFVSLNVPLTNMRIGSSSTRSTHPYFVEQLQELVKELGMRVSLLTPYWLKTKGEMIIGSHNVEHVRAGYLLTRSCSTWSGRFKGHSSKHHCGKCFSCIVRRAALYAAGFIPDEYHVPKLDTNQIAGKEFRDLWAAKLAVQKCARKPPNVLDIIGNAPIPHDVDDFLDVYTRGIEELASFFSA